MSSSRWPTSLRTLFLRVVCSVIFLLFVFVALVCAFIVHAIPDSSSCRKKTLSNVDLALDFYFSFDLLGENNVYEIVCYSARRLVFILTRPKESPRSGSNVFSRRYIAWLTCVTFHFCFPIPGGVPSPSPPNDAGNEGDRKSRWPLSSTAHQAEELWHHTKRSRDWCVTTYAELGNCFDVCWGR